MPKNLEISQEAFDHLMNESIGATNLGDEKVIDGAGARTIRVTLPCVCITTPAYPL